MHQIDFEKADFKDISMFAMNLLQLEKPLHPGSYEAQIAYFSTVTQVLLGRKADESATKLERSITLASNLSDTAANNALAQSKRIVAATWALVIVTGFLGIATAGLVFYTSQLVLTPPTILSVPSSRR